MSFLCSISDVVTCDVGSQLRLVRYEIVLRELGVDVDDLHASINGLIGVVELCKGLFIFKEISRRALKLEEKC